MPRRVEVPERVLALGLLDRVDDGDAFAADCPPETLARYTPEEFGELAMGRAPRWLRTFVRISQHRMLGLQLESSRLSVSLGWELLHGDEQKAVYGVPGRLITPRLVVMKEPRGVLVAFLMRQERSWATPVVAVVKPVHRAVVRSLLGRGIRLASHDTTPADR